MFQFKAIRHEKPFLKFRLETHLCLVLDSRKNHRIQRLPVDLAVWVYTTFISNCRYIELMRNNKHINDIVAIDSDMYLPTSFPRSPLFLNFLPFSREEERRPWKRGFKHNSVLSQMLQSVSAAVRHHCDRQLWVCSRNEIKTVAFPFQFWTTSRIILKRLDYFLSVSKRSIRANYVSLGRNLDLTA